jgi:16S rRNA (guanine1516-N2)-methyltransferase
MYNKALIHLNDANANMNTTARQNPNTCVICNNQHRLPQAQQLAQHLMVDLHYMQSPQHIAVCEFAVVFEGDSIVLQQTGAKAPGPILADFVAGAVDHRRKFGGGKGQMIAKAVGIKAGVYPRVLDATAGLGKDAFVLASLGLDVDLLERSPLVYALLEDGLLRARRYAHETEDAELQQLMSRLRLHSIDARNYLQTISDATRPDVIYLDPMFPDRQKTADVKKDMRAFHYVVGQDLDANELLPLALAAVNYRVVVKRPRKAPFLNAQTPSYQLEGKSSRYDIYTIKKMPDKLMRGS